MNILVTGGNGYIASVLIPMLQEQGHLVTPHDLPGDIRDIKNLKHMNVVVHLAATFSEDWQLSRRINFEAARDLASIAHRDGIDQFVFASTCGVFNPNDISNYTRYKRMAESSIVKRYNYTVIRFGTIYGNAPVWNRKPLVNNLVNTAVRHNIIKVVGSREYRPLIHVNDAAQAICVVIQNELKGYYEAVTEQASKMRIAQIIHKYLPDAELDVTMTSRKGYTVSRSPGLDKHGFVPTMTLEQGIEEMINAQVLQSS